MKLVGREMSRGSMDIDTIQKTGKITTSRTRIARICERIWRRGVILAIMAFLLSPRSDSVAREILFVTSVMTASTMKTMYANDAAMP